MKYIFLVSTILFLTHLNGFAQTQEDHLKRHRTGIYQYADSRFAGYVIKRTKKRQIEYSKEKKEKLVLKIEWKSDSEYWLTLKKSNVSGCLKVGYVIKTQITSATPTSYSSSFIAEGCGAGETKFIKLK